MDIYGHNLKSNIELSLQNKIIAIYIRKFVILMISVTFYFQVCFIRNPRGRTRSLTAQQTQPFYSQLLTPLRLDSMVDQRNIPALVLIKDATRHIEIANLCPDDIYFTYWSGKSANRK